MNDLKQSNMIFEKWKVTGLLQGLSEEFNTESKLSPAIECAIFLEKILAAHIGSELFGNKLATNSIFLIARKMFGDGLRICHRNFVSDFISWFSTNKNLESKKEIIEKFINFYTKEKRNNFIS